MIHLKDINKTYQGAQPLHVLKGIDLDIARGEFVSIMGSSGSGKSTLLNIIGILDNYLDFLVPLILTSAMYSFVYANNFSKVLLEYVCDEYNSWKCGEDVGA